MTGSWRLCEGRGRQELPGSEVERNDGSGGEAGGDGEGLADSGDVPAEVDGDAGADAGDHALVDGADDVGFGGREIVVNDSVSATGADGEVKEYLIATAGAEHDGSSRKEDQCAPVVAELSLRRIGDGG